MRNEIEGWGKGGKIDFETLRGAFSNKASVRDRVVTIENSAGGYVASFKDVGRNGAVDFQITVDGAGRPVAEFPMAAKASNIASARP